jgi:adenylyltransferase/sulfurtransferase
VRYLINDVAVRNEIPMVYGAIHKFEGQVAVFNYKQGATYRCAFPKNESKAHAPNCEEIGVVGVLPGIIGLYQAMEVLKVITGIGKVLTSKIMMVDVLNSTNYAIHVERSDKQVALAKASVSYWIKKEVSGEIMDVSGVELASVLKANTDIQIVDIQHHTNVEHLLGVSVISIPVDTLDDRKEELIKENPVLVYCAHGMNSQWAVQFLKQNGFKKIYHLIGGIASISN